MSSGHTLRLAAAGNHGHNHSDGQHHELSAQEAGVLQKMVAIVLPVNRLRNGAVSGHSYAPSRVLLSRMP